MKRILYTFLICFSGQTIFTQQLLPVQLDTTVYKQEAILSGNAEFGASAIYNEFTSKLLHGGEITDAIKQRSFDHHKTENRFGADVSAEAEYRNFNVNFLGEKWGMVFRLAANNQIGMNYTKDLFGAVFYGNEPYRGKTIDLSGTEILGLSYQKFGFGLISKKYKSSVSLNFYNVYKYASATIRNGQIYQDANFDVMKLAMDAQIDYTSGNSWSNGYGIGIDLDLRFKNPFMHADRSMYQFVVKNLGVAVMNHVTRYSVDTSFTYVGYTFDELFNSNGVFSDNFSFLSKYGIDSSEVNGVVKMLPAMFQLNKMIDEMDPKRFQAFYGVRMYLLPGYVPFVYAGLQTKTWKWMDAGLQLGYGGFSNLKAGMYLQFRLLNQLNIGIASENLGGFFLKKGNGQSLIARLRWKI